MDQLQFPSFCKINWLLYVLGRREDGYHEVRTVLQTIQLHDELYVEVTDSASLEVTTSGRSVPSGTENIVWTAADLLQKRCSIRSGARIHLVKKVPIGAGLGGGSSNAATTLMALNQLWRCGLSRPQLSELAAGIGSDVPFFLKGGTVLASGRGERIEPLADAPTVHLVLVHPNLEISTRKAYSLGRWPRLNRASTLLTKTGVDTKIQRFRDLVDRGRDVRDLIENDFEAPIFRHYHRVAEARSSLLEAGCDRVLLCGSGSTLMGIVSERRARPVAEFVSTAYPEDVFESKTLSQNRYQAILNESGLTF